MASKQQDARAARERKQKIVLAIGGVLFLAIAAFQGPKLWKQLNPPAAPTPASATASVPDPSGTAVVTPAGASAAAASAPKSATTQLAGVVIVREQSPEPDDGQLRSFSAFAPKDPFVQQVDEKASTTAASTPGSAPAAASTPKPKPAPTPSAATSAPNLGLGSSGGVPGVAAATPAAPLTRAVLRVNGVLQYAELIKGKNRFPRTEPAFALRSLKAGKATIAVVGGTFAGGDATLTLRTGRKLILVNTATGVRYVIQLVHVGSSTEQIAGFTVK
jgi:hypothetical protein